MCTISENQISILGSKDINFNFNVLVKLLHPNIKVNSTNQSKFYFPIWTYCIFCLKKSQLSTERQKQWVDKSVHRGKKNKCRYATWMSVSCQGVTWNSHKSEVRISFCDLTAYNLCQEILMLLFTEEQMNLAFSKLPYIFRGRASGMKGRCNNLKSLDAFIDFQPVGLFVCIID